MAKLSFLPGLFAVLVLSACIGGDSSSSDDASGDLVAAAERAVADSLLTLDDLSAGWIAEPQDPDDDIETTFTGECAIYNGDEFPGQVAVADSDEFTGPEGQIVVATAVAFPSEDVAREGMDYYAAFVTGGECHGQLESELASAFRESFLEKGHPQETADSVTVEVGEAPVPWIEAAPQGYRVTWSANVQGTPVGGTMDFIYWREGMMLGGMVYMTSETVDIGEQTMIADIIADKLAVADTSLSQAAATAR